MDSEEIYTIFDISDCIQDGYEPSGTKQKFWFIDKDKFNDGGNDESTRLFKATVALNKKTGEEVQRPGEDWAEKIVCEIATVLNIPCAQYELAVLDGQQGVVTDNFVHVGHAMELGNELMPRLNKLAGLEEVSETKGRQRIRRVYVVLAYLVKRKPIGWDSLPDIKDACDVFVGYLMLDALVANQDRHDENWGVIKSPDGTSHLTPTFDHAASLGRNESDERRREILETRDKGRGISTYARRAKSQLLDNEEKRLKTYDAFKEFGAFCPKAAVSWLKRLESMSDSNLELIINNVPSSIMSGVSKIFAFQLVMENKQRILELMPEFVAQINEREER